MPFTRKKSICHAKGWYAVSAKGIADAVIDKNPSNAVRKRTFSTARSVAIKQPPAKKFQNNLKELSLPENIFFPFLFVHHDARRGMPLPVSIMIFLHRQ